MVRPLPSSTYRLQFRNGVTFDSARALIEYLDALGVDWLYASPILRARQGSEHGYDVVDPTRLDESLGGDEAFEALTAALREADRGLLVDVVPNHMTAHGDNAWWRDLLEHGHASAFASFFDIRWSADPEGRLVLPILGRHYGDVLESGELVLDRDDRGFVVRHHDHLLPLDPRSWAAVLEPLSRALGGDPDIRHLAVRCRQLPPRVGEAIVRKRRAEETERLRDLLSSAVQRPEVGAALERVLQTLRGSPGDPRSFDDLHRLLEAQAWRLAFWRAGLGEINYRRFFDIADLVALRAERREVFDASHRKMLELVRRGAIHGLRIDHIDGLADPKGYLALLREAGVPYVVVEKISAPDEDLPQDWQADGTTGYDYLRVLAPLFVDPQGWLQIEAGYLARRPGVQGLEDCALASKLQVLDELFSPTLHRLSQDLRQLTVHDRRARDVSLSQLERALRALTASLDVYRTYLTSSTVRSEDRTRIRRALRRAGAAILDEDRLALQFIGRVLLGEQAFEGEPAERAAAFVRRWQQLTGAVMAKGLEDTALYRYTPLLALNEVGAQLEMPSDPVQAYHAFAQARLARHPGSLSSTATHDTKRGEDTRARLYALTELAGDWLVCRDLCVRELSALTDESDPDHDEMELLLQSLIGTWPLHESDLATYGERLKAFLIKAAREAKRRTSWLRPDEAVEAAIVHRADLLLGALESTRWGKALLGLQRRVAFLGALNGLAQVVLRIGSPGVCDVYQGTELWDLSMVDPDNRRPVDFAERRRLLRALDEAEVDADFFRDLRETWPDGRIKLWVLSRGSRARRRDHDLFVAGEHRPLQGSGRAAAHLCAFARRHGDAWAIVVAPRLVSSLIRGQEWPLGPDTWGSTVLELPPDAPRRFVDELTGREHATRGRGIALAELLGDLPVALLRGRVGAGTER